MQQGGGDDRSRASKAWPAPDANAELPASIQVPFRVHYTIFLALRCITWDSGISSSFHLVYTSFCVRTELHSCRTLYMNAILFLSTPSHHIGYQNFVLLLAWYIPVFCVRTVPHSRRVLYTWMPCYFWLMMHIISLHALHIYELTSFHAGKYSNFPYTRLGWNI